jgi:hypothetical protein
MGKCDCGSETDWTEINGTWICVACRGEEIEKLMRELREGLEKMEQAERSLPRLRVDTLAIPGLLDKLRQEIKKIKVI